MSTVKNASLMLSRRGELLYALGVVHKAQNNDEESFDYFRRALSVFERADEDGPGKAKTHYKIALHYINMGDVDLAEYASLISDSFTHLRKH